MMHVQGVQFRIRFGDCAERIGIGIKTNSQRDSLSQQMRHLSGRKPVRLIN